MDLSFATVKEKVLAHKLEAAFFGSSLIIFLVSLIIFTQTKIGDRGRGAVIIQKSKFDSGNNMVDIGGAVKRPGVYPLTAGQRVYELVDKAGGLTEEADLTFFDKNINRAQKLNDQVKIYIPFKKAEQLLIPVEPYTSSLISINSSEISDLESLPGVGEVTAKKIIDNRPYGTIEDLLNKKIVKTNVYEEVELLITL